VEPLERGIELPYVCSYINLASFVEYDKFIGIFIWNSVSTKGECATYSCPPNDMSGRLDKNH